MPGFDEATTSTDAAVNLDWMISVDDHVIEPPHVWQSRLPAKYRDTGLRMVGDDWLYEDKKVPMNGLGVAAGKNREHFSPEPVGFDEMRPGCYDPVARLADMDQAGVISSLCFPSVTRFCGQIFHEAKDKELALLGVKAYNDWMVEDWCGSAPGRYIPLTLIPLWDPQLAVQELQRCADMGVHAFAFSENPAPIGLPTIHDPNGYWDPVFDAADDLGMAVCIHIGSSSRIPKIAPDSPPMADQVWGVNRTSGAMLSWLFSGQLQGRTNLKVVLSEGNMGWIPYILERAEQVFSRQRYWNERGVDYAGHSGFAGPRFDYGNFDVRQLFRDHIVGCVLEDEVAFRLLDLIGEDNITVEMDYPHSDSTWPDCISSIRKQIEHFPVSTQLKVLRGNAERIFQFKAPVPAVAAGSAS